MKFTRVKIHELTARHNEAWSKLQRANSTFDSPFFRPEFSSLVAQVSPNVEVAVAECDSGFLGFWPYQRESGNVARPVGLGLCDFQGFVVNPDVVWTPEQLLRACELKAWTFDHLVDPQSRADKHYWSRCDSPVLDLSLGFESYRRHKKESGSSTIEQALRKSRKLEREVGPLRLIPNCDDELVFDSIIKWKRDQYHRIGSVDHLAPAWTRELLRKAAVDCSDDFSGMVSALFAGDRLVAAHLGLRSSGVLHCWFPVYNRDFQAYSPGMVFWLLLAQQASDLGIERIDLGKGDERYKQSLKTGDTSLAEGIVDLNWARGAVRRSWWQARRMLRNSSFASPLRLCCTRFVAPNTGKPVQRRIHLRINRLLNLLKKRWR